MIIWRVIMRMSRGNISKVPGIMLRTQKVLSKWQLALLVLPGIG